MVDGVWHVVCRGWSHLLVFASGNEQHNSSLQTFAWQSIFDLRLSMSGGSAHLCSSNLHLSLAIAIARHVISLGKYSRYVVNCLDLGCHANLHPFIGSRLAIWEVRDIKLTAADAWTVELLANHCKRNSSRWWLSIVTFLEIMSPQQKDQKLYTWCAHPIASAAYPCPPFLGRDYGPDQFCIFLSRQLQFQHQLTALTRQFLAPDQVSDFKPSIISRAFRCNPMSESVSRI